MERVNFIQKDAKCKAVILSSNNHRITCYCNNKLFVAFSPGYQGCDENGNMVIDDKYYIVETLAEYCVIPEADALLEVECDEELILV